MSKGSTPAPKSSIKSFTLIELIVVIIIVGILAAIGLTQYSKTVERGRGAEARAILGDIRKLAYNFYLENGTLVGVTDADMNIGSDSDQIPSVCRSTHYFAYRRVVLLCNTGSVVRCWLATRCTSGGKTPQRVGSGGLTLRINVETGVDTWTSNGGY